MSTRNALALLAERLAQLYEVALTSMDDPAERAEVLTQMGLKVPAGAPPARAGADAAVGQLRARAADDVETAADLAALLEALTTTSAVVKAVVEDVGNENPGVAVHTILAGYLNIVLAGEVRRERPGLAAVLEAFKLIDAHELHFERFGSLLEGGGEILRGGAAEGDEEREADAYSLLLGALAAGLLFLPEPQGGSFQRRVLYGFDLDPAAGHPNAERVLNRTIGTELALHGGAADGELLMTMAFVPPHHGGSGLFLSLGGGLELTIPVGESLELKLEADLHGGAEALIGKNGFFRALGGDGGAAPDAALKATFGRAGGESKPLLVGAEKGVHFELKDFELVGEVGSRRAGVLARAKGAALVVPQQAAGDLLGALLPSAGLRFGGDLGLGWNGERGVYLEGGAGLKTTLAIGASVLGLELRTLTIELELKLDEPRGVALALTGAFRLGMGPLTLSAGGLGASLTTSFPADRSGSIMGAETGLEFLPPRSIGIAIETETISGGGFVELDPERGEYSGVLELKLKIGKRGVQVKAFGILSRRPGGGWAFIVVLSAELEPEIELFMRFTLGGVGGIFGSNHALSLDALRAGLRDGALDRLLFPADPVANAPAILQTLRTVFPVAEGRTVVGLMLRIAWGAPLKLVRISAALAISTPDPTVFALLGRLQVAAPTPEKAVVDLHADFVVAIDFSAGTVSVDASLVNSRLAIYPLNGDLAFRADEDGFLLSIGGFHPEFSPPANVPQLRRLGVDVSKSKHVKLRLETYLALSSNTMQLGARAQLDVKVGRFGVHGWLGFDALAEINPFRFSVRVSAGIELRYDGSVLASLHADLEVTGPGRWKLKGKVSMSILFWKIRVPIKASWGKAEEAVAAATIDLIGQVREELSGDAAWAAELPATADALVTLRNPAAKELRLHPLGLLTARQRVAPLGIAVTHIGEARLKGGPGAVHLGQVSLGTAAAAPVAGPVEGRFPRAQYLDLSDDEKLSSPSFERFQDGISIGAEGVLSGPAVSTEPEWETILVGVEAPRVKVPLALRHLGWALAEGAVARSGLHRATLDAGPDQRVSLAPQRAAVVDTNAMQAAADVLAAPAGWTAAEQALAALAAEDPTRAANLQVVEAHEVAV